MTEYTTIFQEDILFLFLNMYHTCILKSYVELFYPEIEYPEYPKLFRTKMTHMCFSL